MGSGLAYNVWRWYQPATGRFARPDPHRDWPIFQVYGYAEQNPVLWFDPDGRDPIPNPYVGDPFMKLGCISGATTRAATGLVGTEGPRWAHCMASCEIAKCGGASMARDLGLLKEGFDTVTCLALKRLGVQNGGIGRILHDKQCDSAFQEEDFQDNEFGVACPKDVTCEERCDRFRARVNTAPGPFRDFPLSIPARR